MNDRLLKLEKQLNSIEDKIDRLIEHLDIPLSPGCYIFQEDYMNVVGKAKSELVSVLKSNVIDIVFEKKDGTERKMTCTLAPEFINYETAGQSVEADSLVTVWDLDKEAWRRFRIESLREFNVVEE